MKEPVGVEIFIIGNEILIGDIQDTNSSWLCREIDSLGGRVERVTVLRDDADTIAGELRAALARGPRVILTSGGLGPTADDLTLAAVAQGAGVEFALDAKALEMVRVRYDELAAGGIISQGGLNPPREKMAWLPVGAEPLHNPVGTAPGVLFRMRDTAIISLPGVPPELKAIFAGSLKPFLAATFVGGLSASRTVTVLCNDESLMEPVLTRIAQSHPRIYVKSLAKPLGVTPELDIILAAVGDDPVLLARLLDAALLELGEGLAGLGIGYRLSH